MTSTLFEVKTPTTKLIVMVDVINTTKEYKWRLRTIHHQTDWTSYYEGILTFEIDNNLIGYATQYWTDVLPTETPFLIIKSRKL